MDIVAMSPGFVTVTGDAGEPQRVGSVTATANILAVPGR